MRQAVIVSLVLAIFSGVPLSAAEGRVSDADKVTTSTSQAGLNQIQPQNVVTGEAKASGEATVVGNGGFPPTPTPKPPEKPMTQEQLDKHVVPSNVLNQTSNVISLAYSGYRRSTVDPCGCVTHQLGGIDKEARLIKRLEELKIPVVTVDAGGFVRDMPTDRDFERSKTALQALKVMGVDAVNVSFTDLGGGVDKLKEIATAADVKLISANVAGGDGNLLFDPYVIIDAKTAEDKPIKIGVIGVTRPRVAITTKPSDAAAATTGSATGAQKRGAGNSFTITDPTEALVKHVPELRGKADVVVALLYDRRDHAPTLINTLSAEAHPDVVITSEWLNPNTAIMNAGSTRIVSAGFEGRQMGLLTLGFEGTKLSTASNQLVEILQTIPPLAEVTAVMEKLKSSPTARATPAATPAKLKLN